MNFEQRKYKYKKIGGQKYETQSDDKGFFGNGKW